jgi:proline-specific peptidase
LRWTRIVAGVLGLGFVGVLLGMRAPRSANRQAGQVASNAARLALALVVFGLRPALAQVEVGWDERDEWYLGNNDGCRLYVTDFGTGETVVALHGGFGAEHSYLIPAFAGLADRYHFVLYDQRGSLRSPCPDSLISVERHIADLNRLRAELGLSRVTLVGHSMGTYLAMAYLQRHPQRVKGLVLIGAVRAKTPQNAQEDSLQQQQQMAGRAFVERPEIEAEIREQGLNREHLSQREQTHKWRIRFAGANIVHVERWRQMRGGQVFYSSRAGSAASKTLPQTWNFLDDLRSHPYPITVVLGDHDYVDMGARRWRRWVSDISNVELVVIERAGHVVWLDQPAHFRRALERVLAQER